MAVADKTQTKFLNALYLIFRLKSDYSDVQTSLNHLCVAVIGETGGILFVPKTVTDSGISPKLLIPNHSVDCADVWFGNRSV